MAINLDVVIESPENSVDMKSGLDTLQGVSDATRSIVETVLTGRTPKRKDHRGKVRTTLKQSFRGSYGHEFSIDVFDDILDKRRKAIGNEVMAELISYFLQESLFIEGNRLSKKAEDLVERMEGLAEDLIGSLRESALDNIHRVSVNFDQDVSVRYRRNRAQREVLASFNRDTAEVLNVEESDEVVDLTVGITRLNINTGNGRLLIEGEEETVAFGFDSQYRDVRIEAKKLFSENLDHNNGIEREGWNHLRISASPVKRRDEKVVKYIVKGFYK